MKITNPIPTELKKDEEKWLKFFPRETIIVFLIGGAIAFFVGQIFKLIGLMWPAVIFVGLITVIIAACTMIPIMDGNYLKGGRQSLASYLLKKYCRKKNEIVYTKGYNQYIWDKESEE